MLLAEMSSMSKYILSPAVSKTWLPFDVHMFSLSTATAHFLYHRTTETEPYAPAPSARPASLRRISPPAARAFTLVPFPAQLPAGLSTNPQI